MKTLARYRLMDNLKSLGILMVVLIAIPALLSVFSGSSEMNGMTTITGSIWALVIGIIVLRGDLRMGNQFGVSRRSAFWGSVLACTAAFAACAAVLTAYTWLLQLLTNGNVAHLSVADIYQILYSTSTTYLMPAKDYLVMFLFGFTLNLCLGFFGMLCTLAFWRLNKFGKWVLGVGMGLGLGVGLPNLLYRLSPWILRPLRILTTNVWAMMGFFLIWAAVFLLGACLLYRRANIIPAAK